MDNINPTVITSKMAQDHLNEIKIAHSDVLTGMANHAIKVQNFNQQKQQEQMQNEQQTKVNQDANQKAMADAATKKLEAENKAKELQIKQQALSMP